MVMFRFQKQFIGPILAGTKQQTLRTPRKRDARAGDTLQLYSGSRYKPAIIGHARCISADPIRLDFANGAVWIGAGHFAPTIHGMDALHDFARMDGFPSWGHLVQFWRETHERVAVWDGVRTFWGDTFVAPQASAGTPA